MSGSLRVTLGLDLRPQTTGALQYCLWLCDAAQLQPAGHIDAVHVIEPEAMVELLRHADEQAILGAFTQRGRELLDELARGRGMHAPRIVGGEAVAMLEQCARAEGATALVISRRARADAGLTFSRLGSVARRLLRRLPLPVIVAPPELLASEVGAGPVLVAVDFSEDCVRALRWAQELARLIERPLQLVHFAELPDQLGHAGIVHGEHWVGIVDDLLARAREHMAAFVRAHELGEVDTVVERGPVLPALADHAANVSACLLVTGSGHHGLLHRVIVPSVASETAAMASLAVAVVP